MNREVHVRFWEGLAVRFRWATQLVLRPGARRIRGEEWFQDHSSPLWGGGGEAPPLIWSSIPRRVDAICRPS